jgi:hypothetical protein
MGLLGTLLNNLKTSEVTFVFRTKSGKIRQARGTLNQDRIPKEDWSKGKKFRMPAPKVDEFTARTKKYQPYYDLNVGEWRRFSPFSIMRIISSRPISNISKIEDDDLNV